MTVAPDRSTHDWLGACRRAADGLRAVLERHPTSAERVVETGDRGGGGDRTLVIDAEAEDVVFAELERAARRRARASPSSPRSAGSSTSAPAAARLRRRRPDRRLAERQARPAAPRALDRGRRRARRWPTSPSATSTTSARPRSGAPSRGGGAFLDGVRARPPARAARRRTAGSSSSPSSPPTRAGWRASSEALCERHAAASARSGRSRSRCARSPPAASTAMASLWNCRAVDAAAAQLIVRESGGLVAFTALRRRRSPRRWTSSRTPRWSRPARRRALGRAARPSRRHEPRLAPGRARRRGRGRVERRGHRPAGRPRRPGPHAPRSAIVGLTGLRPRAPLPRARGRRPRGVGAREPRDDAGDARPARRRSCRTRPRGRSPAAARRGRARSWPARSAGWSGSWPARPGPVRARRSSTEEAPARLLLVAPNIRDAARELRRRPRRAADAGSRSTRSPTPCSSAPCRGCARTSAACCASSRVGRRQGRPHRARCGCRRATTSSRGGRGCATAGSCSAPGRGRAQGAARPRPGRDGAGRGPRRARHGRGRRAAAALAAGAARGARPPPRRAPAAAGALLERLLGLELKMRQYEVGSRVRRRGRRAGRDGGAQPRLDAAPSACPRWPSSRTPPPGCAARRCRCAAAPAALSPGGRRGRNPGRTVGFTNVCSMVH